MWFLICLSGSVSTVLGVGLIRSTKSWVTMYVQVGPIWYCLATIHCIYHDGCGTWLYGACHSSLFIFQRNLIGPTDLLEYIPVCYQLSSNAKPMSCTIYSVLSCNVVRKQDVWVRQLVHTVGQNTVYQFEWFWQNAQCTSQNRLGESVHRVLSQNVHSSWTNLRSWPQYITVVLEVVILGFIVFVIAPYLFTKNLIRPIDLLEYIPVCHWSSSNAKSIYSVLSCNVVRKWSVRVGLLWPE